MCRMRKALFECVRVIPEQETLSSHSLARYLHTHAHAFHSLARYLHTHAHVSPHARHASTYPHDYAHIRAHPHASPRSRPSGVLPELPIPTLPFSCAEPIRSLTHCVTCESDRAAS